MSNPRKIVFVNNYYYHIFNRGLDKRITFSDKRDYSRARELLQYYNHSKIPLRYSQFHKLSEDKKQIYLEQLNLSEKCVDIIAYCLMTNHFHLLLRQKAEYGISTFVSNFTNAYTRYFNTKNNRTGILFQGIFKGVFVESDEQLLHLTRYIHLNPVIASMTNIENLLDYRWSSYPVYIGQKSEDLQIDTQIMQLIGSSTDYAKFVKDQISYAKELHKIKHLSIEDD